MASLRLSSVPSQTSLLLSLSSPSKFCISSLAFQRSHVNSRLPKLHISSSTTTDTNNTVATPCPTPTTETFDWYSQWYPLDPVCDLDKGAPKARTVMGLDVVIWWDRAEGAWNVFEDRCPHRLAPLSEGRIDNKGRLQCVYHGWCFNGSGACRYIPQAPALGPPVHVNRKACVAVYPSIVQNNILWFWPNTSPASKDVMHERKPQYVPEMDDPSYFHVITTRDFFYGYEIHLENLVDPAHVPYAHYGILDLKQYDDPGRVETDREGGTPIELTIKKSDMSGFDAGSYKFIAPCSIHLSVIKNFSESTGKASCNAQKYLTIMYCVPVSPGKSRLICASMWNFANLINKILPRWYIHININLLLDSDHYLLHMQEKKVAAEGISNWHNICYVPTQSDKMVVAFKTWLRKYSNNRVNWRTKDFSLLPTSPPREQLMERYRSHVIHCKSCSRALRTLNAMKIALQVISITITGMLAAANRSLISNITKASIVVVAILSFVASHWLSQFIHKTFYYHDYNHSIHGADSLIKKILDALWSFRLIVAV